MPLARAEFAVANSRVLSAFTGRILTGPAINQSPNARAATVYNGEGLIVSVPDVEAAAALRDALWDVLADFSCEPNGPEWLSDPGEPLRPTSFGQSTAGSSSVLAGGVKIIPKTAADGQNSSAPDPWSIVEALRSRMGPDFAASVGLNHLMSSAEQVGGNPLAVGHGRVGLDLYGSIGWGGHGPVTLISPSRPSVTGRRPRVVVLDTGIGDHPWFRVDPVETAVRFADGFVVGPDIATNRQRAAGAPAESVRPGGGDLAGNDPLLGTLPSHAGHGTFIAGLLRQACPAADVVALTVMDETGIVPEHKLIRALDVLRARQRECAGWADAVVLSLGYYAETGEDVRYTSGLKDILLDLGRLGVAVFAAAGNDASRRPSYPAAFAVDPDFDDPDVLPVVSVAALDSDGTVAPFSNDGPWVTAEALGVNLVSASPVLLDGGGRPQYSTLGPGGRRRSAIDPDDYRSGFAVWSGTSFAAPLLAGDYLGRLLAEGFPPGNQARRALLPLGRRSRVDPTMVPSKAVSA